MKEDLKFPTVQQVLNASVPQVQSMYNKYSCPKTEDEIAVMKTIIQRNMRIRRLKKEGKL